MGETLRDRLYRWRGEIEQLAGKVLEVSSGDRAQVCAKLEAIADEVFEEYLNENAREAREVERTKRGQGLASLRPKGNDDGQDA